MNPHDALPLPPYPSLEQYKKLAKDLVKAGRSADPAAIRNWAAAWVDSLVRLSSITLTPQLPVRIEGWVAGLEEFVGKQFAATPTLAGALFVIARAQGFESWPMLAKHLESVARAAAPINHFERAADAIVTGDLARLERLLRDQPALIYVRSTRRHHATLLHYISANGIEGYRQKTPANIVEVAAHLLRAGADVNAVAELYGGSTTLGLVATSAHPERAGVLAPLLQLLIDHGAMLDKGIVSACLSNGRLAAAEFLEDRGAPLDLEAAAGLGRLDLVKTFCDHGVQVSQQSRERALLWASEYGRNSVVEFLLDRGIAIQAQANTGQTALHWAVIGGQIETVKLLLRRDADPKATNVHGGTAVRQAEWSASNGDPRIDYASILTLLKDLEKS